MKLQNRLAIVILVIFFGGWLIAGASAFILEKQDARANVANTARILLSTAISARNYTTERIEPLSINDDGFVREKVPSFAAQELFDRLNEDYPGYSYSERALNPTNPKDLAEAWQVELIQYFIQNPDAQEVVDERVNRGGQSTLFVAEPIRVNSTSCLECHSTPDVAPPGLIKTYGRSNGFGWELNETIGTRIISVPTEIQDQQAISSVFSYLVLIAGVFLLAYAALSIIVRNWLTIPLGKITQIVEEISLRETEIKSQLPEDRTDAIGRLNRSINRLITTLNKALLNKEENIR